LNKIRIWDFVAAQRVDLFIANSQTVQKRIQKYYRRSSEVIYPPVELNKFKISTELGDYFLIGGRLAPYKRVDIVIEAFKKMPDKKLKIFGDGVDLKRLQNLADNVANIKFLGRVDENKKAELYSRCLAFINPQEEDFGITVIEAMASGRPVIAYKKGGATETVINEKTGLFFNKQSNESLIEVIKNFTEINFNPEEIKKQAENFSEATFKEKMFNFINKNL
jgi:glycosyltransferase involved in cell wall biosynthesis